MLFTSPVYSQASGSIAGITYSHNRGGMYTRARVTPTDKSSELQQTVRAIMGTLAPYWGQTLDAAERAAWDLYAANVPWTNPIGQTIFLTGQQHFLRCNVVRVQCAQEILEVAPIIYDLGTFTAPTIDAATDAPNLDIAYNAADDWATEVNGFMAVYAGKSIGPGRNFYRGPFRLANVIAGEGSAPGSPASMTPDWPWSADNRAWVQCRIVQDDGRMSLPIILGPEIITGT